MCDVWDAVESVVLGPVGMVDAALGNPMADIFFGDKDPDSDMSLFQVDYLKNHRAEYDDWAGQYTDPTRYRTLTDEYMQNASTRAANQFGSVGLAGSGAAIGGASEAGRKVEMDMMNRQLSDRTAIENTRLGYTSQLQNAGTAQMNAEIAKQNADNQMLGGLLSLAGGAAGAYFGGPMGAAAGSKIGGSLAGGQSEMLPMSTAQYGGVGNGGSYDPYSSYGSADNYWSQNPYSY